MKKPKGFIVLEGGAEFSGRMADVDLRAIELAGGNSAKLDIIPAAAAPDQNHGRAGSRGVKWFTHLGATRVTTQPLIDHKSAQDPELADRLATSNLLFLLGGFPGHLADSLKESRCWQSMIYAWQKGAVLVGSSAGAMVLASHFYDPQTDRIEEGLALLKGVCIIPHYSTFAERWHARLSTLLPQTTLLGIDEETGIIDDGQARKWTVYGKGNVCIIGKEFFEFKPGETILRQQLSAGYKTYHPE